MKKRASDMKDSYGREINYMRISVTDKVQPEMPLLYA